MVPNEVNATLSRMTCFQCSYRKVFKGDKFDDFDDMKKINLNCSNLTLSMFKLSALLLHV